MKLAVPTNDKVTISNKLRESAYFKVITFCGLEVIDEEFRKSPLAEGRAGSIITNLESDAILTLLADCDTLIGGTYENDLCKSRVRNFINTVTTERSIITSAAIEINKKILLDANNTCCSP